jgi:hypothetical protein
VSEHHSPDTPETPEGAVRTFIGTLAFAAGFEGLSMIMHGEWAIGLAGVLGCAFLGWLTYKWPSVNRRWVGRLTITTNKLAVLWVVTVTALILGLAYSPLVTLKTWRFDKDTKLETIIGRTYSNQTLHIDGYEFRDCTFLNVTFIYEGKAPFLFIDAHFGNMIGFGSPNPAINLALGLDVRLFESRPLIGHKHVSPEEMR